MSNFTVHHLNRLRSEATIVPAVNFELDDGEMALLSSLSGQQHAGRIGPDPDHFNAT